MSNTRQVLREALVGSGAPAKASKNEPASQDGVLTQDPHVSWGGASTSSPLEAVGTSYLDDDDDGECVCASAWAEEARARESEEEERGERESRRDLLSLQTFARARAVPGHSPPPRPLDPLDPPLNPPPPQRASPTSCTASSPGASTTSPAPASGSCAASSLASATTSGGFFSLWMLGQGPSTERQRAARACVLGEREREPSAAAVRAAAAALSSSSSRSLARV